ncbi:MAG TPA: hypothetical protein VI912_01505 [Candidatus Bilamarchaeaceae archaeon]|nr:hypothetical protein [Candidatus Bilamarchaeaceae archaeon]
MYETPLRHFVNDILLGFKNRNQKKLRKLNDIILKEAVLHFTKPTFELGVFAYILSKLVSKTRFLKKQNDVKFKEIEAILKDLSKNIDRLPESQCLLLFRDLENDIIQLEEEDKRYITNLVTKGRLKAAALLYAQGVSIGVASDVTGINKQDIQSYAGKTRMFDRLEEPISIKDRMKIAHKLIGG